MANMSYCRFENTSKDMQDCWNALAEVDNLKEWFDNLNEYEQRGFRNLMRLSERFTTEIAQECENWDIEL